MNRSPLRQEEQKYIEGAVQPVVSGNMVQNEVEPTPEQPAFDPTSYQDVYTKMREAGLSKEEMTHVLKTMKAKKEQKEQALIDDKRRKKLATETAKRKTAIRDAKNVQDWGSNLEYEDTHAFTNNEGVEYTLNEDNQWISNGEVVDQDAFKKHQLPQYYNQTKDLSKETNYSLNQDNSVTMIDPEGESQDYYRNEEGNWVYDKSQEGAGDGKPYKEIG